MSSSSSGKYLPPVLFGQIGRDFAVKSVSPSVLRNVGTAFFLNDFLSEYTVKFVVVRAATNTSGHFKTQIRDKYTVLLILK